MKHEGCCEFCNVLVRFCKLEDGRWICLDYAPVDDGGEYACVVDEARYVPKANRTGKRLHRKHAETCAKREERREFYRQRRRRPSNVVDIFGGSKRGA